MTATLTRFQDWEARLMAEMEATAHVLCQYGEHDCCKSAARLIAAMTGVDISADFPVYTQRKKAFRIIARNGGFDRMLAAIAAKYKLEEVPPTMARRGDPVMLATERGMAAGIVDLTGKRIIIPAGRGWTFVPISHASRAWRLG